jgi:tRNA-dihydrouridine synthase
MTGRTPPPPTVEDRLAMFLRHYRLLAAARGAERAMRDMRSHFAWYTRGIPQSARLRAEVMAIATPAAFEAAVTGFLEAVRARGESGAPTPLDPPTDPRLHFRGAVSARPA